MVNHSRNRCNVDPRLVDFSTLPDSSKPALQQFYERPADIFLQARAEPESGVHGKLLRVPGRLAKCAPFETVSAAMHNALA